MNSSSAYLPMATRLATHEAHPTRRSTRTSARYCVEHQLQPTGENKASQSQRERRCTPFCGVSRNYEIEASSTATTEKKAVTDRKSESPQWNGWAYLRQLSGSPRSDEARALLGSLGLVGTDGLPKTDAGDSLRRRLPGIIHRGCQCTQRARPAIIR